MASSPFSSRSSRGRIIFLSMVAATVIWLFNKLNKEGYSLQVRYPINLTYNDSLYIPISPLPKTVSAMLNGSGWTLLRKSLSFTVSPVSFPLHNPLGSNTINTNALAAMMTEQVKDARISHVILDNANLSFEERVVKRVVLKADSMGIDLSSKFVVSSFINLRPNTINFDGPASLVSDIPDTILVRISAKKIRGNYDEELPIRYPQSPLLKVSAEKVFVSFEVAEFLENPASISPKSIELQKEKLPKVKQKVK